MNRLSETYTPEEIVGLRDQGFSWLEIARLGCWRWQHELDVRSGVEEPIEPIPQFPRKYP